MLREHLEALQGSGPDEAGVLSVTIKIQKGQDLIANITHPEKLNYSPMGAAMAGCKKPEYSNLRSQTIKDFSNFPQICGSRETMYLQTIKTLHVFIVRSHDVTSQH